MIILDYIHQMKQSIPVTSDSFLSFLQQASHVDFKKKDEILSLFHSIDIKEKGRLIHLKYNVKKMFKQPWNEFFMNARALVLDWVSEEIILYPFDKFFELDEHSTTKLSVVKKAWEMTNKIEVTEKIDGSLMPVRFYEGEFFFVSSGSFESPHVTMAKEILSKDSELQRFIQNHPDYTIILEMKNKTIPQLVKYNEDKLTIIGMRHMSTFSLLHHDEIQELAKSYFISVVSTFSLSIKEMLEIMENPNSTHMEGYIVRLDDLLVKMKTKNFILANRFGGDPSKNFNMVVESINENRLESIRPMVKKDYTESFDVTAKLIQNYAIEKEETIRQMFNEISSIVEMEDFAREAQKKFHGHVKSLIAMKNNYYQKLTKEDIKFLKTFSSKLISISHIKYAELNNLDIAFVVEQLENGSIQYLKKFTDSYQKQDIYIIHLWQWIDFDQIKFQK